MVYKFFVPPTDPVVGWHKFICDGIVDHQDTRLVTSATQADFVIIGLFSQVSKKVLNDKERLIVVDYSDRPSRLIPANDCLLYFKRSVYDKETGNLFGAQVIPIGFPIKKEFLELRPESAATNRTLDLACFFESNYRDISWNNNRSRVARLLKRTFSDSRFRTQIGHVGQAGNLGRNVFQNSYQNALCESRIVVTCNPDLWEGDHRLYEALSSGALVMIDEMQTPLQNKFNDGEHLIYYRLDDLDDLLKKCFYYLEHEEERLKIAQCGYEYALKHHTYVSRIDEILSEIKKARLV